jgi:hypothetical protein
MKTWDTRSKILFKKLYEHTGRKHFLIDVDRFSAPISIKKGEVILVERVLSLQMPKEQVYHRRRKGNMSPSRRSPNTVIKTHAEQQW